MSQAQMDIQELIHAMAMELERVARMLHHPTKNERGHVQIETKRTARITIDNLCANLQGLLDVTSDTDDEDNNLLAVKALATRPDGTVELQAFFHHEPRDYELLDAQVLAGYSFDEYYSPTRATYCINTWNVVPIYVFRWLANRK